MSEANYQEVMRLLGCVGFGLLELCGALIGLCIAYMVFAGIRNDAS